MALDWFAGCDAPSFAPPEAPILLVLHGVNGGSHEGYCKWACAAAQAKGWRSLVLNYRGCNGLPLTSSRGYAATLSSDVLLAIESIRGRFPGAPICAAGYSLGSMLLTKWVWAHVWVEFVGWGWGLLRCCISGAACTRHALS